MRSTNKPETNDSQKDRLNPSETYFFVSILSMKKVNFSEIDKFQNNPSRSLAEKIIKKYDRHFNFDELYQDWENMCSHILQSDLKQNSPGSGA